MDACVSVHSIAWMHVSVCNPVIVILVNGSRVAMKAVGRRLFLLCSFVSSGITWLFDFLSGLHRITTVMAA